MLLLMLVLSSASLCATLLMLKSLLSSGSVGPTAVTCGGALTSFFLQSDDACVSAEQCIGNHSSGCAGAQKCVVLMLA